MKESTLANCRQLMENRERIRSVFPWEDGTMNLCCAGIYAAKGVFVDQNMLQRSKELMKHRVGMFSNFRGSVHSAVAAMLAVSGSPEQTLENGLQVYEILKKRFWGSEHLCLAAMLIAQAEQPYRYEEIAERTRTIYDRMKEKHPFLTSGEDSAFCALMALSERSEESLVTDMENCYQELKPYFFSSNAVQSLSHVLALCDGTSSSKCRRTMELFDLLKKAGRKYGTDYELPTLGVLAMSGADLESIASEMIEIDEWLSEQKGFGFFSSITKKQRLMYAGILARRDYIQEDTVQTATVGAAISLIAAEQAAMYAAIAASTAATAASNNNQ